MRRFLGRLSLALLLGACGPKVMRETILDSEEMRVELRRLPPPKNLPAVLSDHPVTIADVRIAHILASLSHRDPKGKQRPTIGSESIYGLAEGLAKAAARATPEDEIAAAVYSSQRRMVLFQSERVTSFRVFFRGTDMVIEFLTIDDPLDLNPRSSEYKIPVRAPKWKPGFTLLAGRGRVVQGQRTVRVDWRDPYFSRPVRIGTRGGFRRRTILMETPDPEEQAEEVLEERPAALEDAQTRALDQLEAVRRSGMIPESEYKRRRELILAGRLEEAGYAPASKP